MFRPCFSRCRWVRVRGDCRDDAVTTIRMPTPPTPSSRSARRLSPPTAILLQGLPPAPSTTGCFASAAPVVVNLTADLPHVTHSLAIRGALGRRPDDRRRRPLLDVRFRHSRRAASSSCSPTSPCATGSPSAAVAVPSSTAARCGSGPASGRASRRRLPAPIIVHPVCGARHGQRLRPGAHDLVEVRRCTFANNVSQGVTKAARSRPSTPSWPLPTRPSRAMLRTSTTVGRSTACARR